MAKMTNQELVDAATTIWAAAEGCIDYPHLDRLALPAGEPGGDRDATEYTTAEWEAMVAELDAILDGFDIN